MATCRFHWSATTTRKKGRKQLHSIMSTDEELQFRTTQRVVRRREPLPILHARTLKVIITSIFIGTFFTIGTIAEVLHNKEQSSLSSQGTSKSSPVFASLALVADSQLDRDSHSLNLFRSRQERYRFYPRYHRRLNSSTDPSIFLQRWSHWAVNAISTEAETRISSGGRGVFLPARSIITVIFTSKPAKLPKNSGNNDGSAIGRTVNVSKAHSMIAFNHSRLIRKGDKFSQRAMTSSVAFMNMTLQTSTEKMNYSDGASARYAATGISAYPVIVNRKDRPTEDPASLSQSMLRLMNRETLSAPGLNVSSEQLFDDATATASTMDKQSRKEEDRTKRKVHPSFSTTLTSPAPPRGALVKPGS